MIDDTKQIRCSDCIYWSKNPKEFAVNGQCRRFPPTIQRTDGGIRSQWPLVESFWWCGEHTVIETGAA